MNTTHLNIISKRVQARQCGAAVVEFALLLILLLIIVAGVVEFGRTFWYYDALTKATRDGARFLSNARESSTVAINASHIDMAKTMVANAATLAQVPGFNSGQVTVTCDTACGANPTYITVSIGYPVTIGSWIPFVTLVGAPWDATLSPYTTMRYMR
ncbi:MAG: TadE family protein [Methylotenera sp.]